MTMNKLIMVITIAVLSQAAMGNDGDNPSSSVLVRAWQTKIEADNAYANGATLKNAEAVTERTKSEADRVYRKGVARRNELHQWSDAIAAFNSVKARYDLLKLIQGNAQSNYDHYVRWYGWCWWQNACVEDKKAAKHWRGLMNRTHLNIEVAKAWATPNGISMQDELVRAKKHLAWIKEEEYQAQLVKWIVDSSFDEDAYKQLAALTINSARGDIVKAKAAVTRASNRVAPVSYDVLHGERKAKYKAANAYFNEQKNFYYSEQYEVETANIELMTVLQNINHQ